MLIMAHRSHQCHGHRFSLSGEKTELELGTVNKARNTPEWTSGSGVTEVLVSVEH